MSNKYSEIFENLRMSLPFLRELILVKNQEKILFSSHSINLEKFLPEIINCWTKSPQVCLESNDKQYIVRTISKQQIIITIPGESHLIGLKDKNLLVIAQIELDGIIPFTQAELTRLLQSIKAHKLYAPRRLKEDRESYHKLENLPKEKSEEISFTARLMAYHRGKEGEKKKPLIKDPISSILAGDLTEYFKKHKRHTKMDYPIVRSYYIEKNFLSSWCKNKLNSQIVLLGAGLDSRAYRFNPLEVNEHVLYEIDLERIINYKEEKLKDISPLCDLKRISADLNQQLWISKLKKEGFSLNIPTFWILEGLVYYLELHQVKNLLKKICGISHPKSRIFLDILHKSHWLGQHDSLYINDPQSFSRHFKWGMDIKDIPDFFNELGWDIECVFADKFDHGRDVGQKAMIFIDGIKKNKKITNPSPFRAW